MRIASTVLLLSTWVLLLHYCATTDVENRPGEPEANCRGVIPRYISENSWILIDIISPFDGL